jgi:hypothetical protein
MIGDENVIIRRLLNSLAFCCATVYSIPTTIPLFMNQNLQVSTLNIPVNYTQVSKVPMIYIRLLPPLQQITPVSTPITIQDSLTTTQPIMYNGKLESRMMSVVNTDGVLVVVIPRRTFKPLGNNIYNLPAIFNFSNMPHHAFGLEMLNDTTVLTNTMIHYGATNKNPFDNKLYIKSLVVLKEKTQNNNNFIYGTKSVIVNYNYITAAGAVAAPVTPVTYHLDIYDPLDAFDQTTREYIPYRYKDHRERVQDFNTKQTILIYSLDNRIKSNISTNYLHGGGESNNKFIDNIKATYEQIYKDGTAEVDGATYPQNKFFACPTKEIFEKLIENKDFDQTDEDEFNKIYNVKSEYILKANTVLGNNSIRELKEYYKELANKLITIELYEEIIKQNVKADGDFNGTSKQNFVTYLEKLGLNVATIGAIKLVKKVHDKLISDGEKLVKDKDVIKQTLETIKQSVNDPADLDGGYTKHNSNGGSVKNNTEQIQKLKQLYNELFE